MNGYDYAAPRPVLEGEIDELMEWGLPKYQEIYPRCTAASVRPLLVLACRHDRMRFLRTENAAALFLVETSPWEPEPYCYQVLIVSRVVAPREFMRLMLAMEAWAEEIGAIGFEYGGIPGQDWDAAASRIGYDAKNTRYIKTLRNPAEERVGG